MKSLNLGDAQTHIVGSKNRSKNIFFNLYEYQQCNLNPHYKDYE
jgi:hypothetical protein